MWLLSLKSNCFVITGFVLRFILISKIKRWILRMFCIKLKIDKNYPTIFKRVYLLRYLSTFLKCKLKQFYDNFYLNKEW